MNSKFTKIVRILLGIILIAFGVNKMYSFIPLPQPSDDAADFMDSLADTGYVLNVVAIFEIFIGILLLIKKWVPFAMLLLLPLSLNILLFHLFRTVILKPAVGIRHCAAKITVGYVSFVGLRIL